MESLEPWSPQIRLQVVEMLPERKSGDPSKSLPAAATWNLNKLIREVFFGPLQIPGILDMGRRLLHPWGEGRTEIQGTE